MPPSLVRQDALVGGELRNFFIQPRTTTVWVVPDPPDMDFLDDPFYVPPKSLVLTSQDSLAMKRMLTEAARKRRKERELSAFEKLISTHPPVFESLLAHLPTRTLFNLYHTSSYLQAFLQSYPTAWSHLSFRLAQSSLLSATPGGGSTGVESPNNDRQSKAYALDQLLMTLVLPFGTRLKSLDLDNTLVSGLSLTSTVLPSRKDTLTHLSVRGCKNVSLKYHIVPYLQLHLKIASRAKGKSPGFPGVPTSILALKSLYTYRCRHHRRRPYLPISLVRRDSDSEPTHELVNICHKLGIWTDTAWCPTPGGRCLRRRDYHTGRGGSGTGEVWVVFDRLWRSGNRIGQATENQEGGQPRKLDGRMWEEAEYGDDGEALGHGGGLCLGEGKQLATHLRRSHKIFIDDIFCDGCGDKIPERCEQCSVRMHCMGCRRSFCSSCAFDRRLPKRPKLKLAELPSIVTANEPALESILGQLPATIYLHHRAASTTRDRFWWAPGATRSPNLMREPSGDSESDSEMDDNGAGPASNRAPPKLNLKWCCLEPTFSGGGGIAFSSPGMGGQGADKIRTAPLPRGSGWEDDDFHTAPDLDGGDCSFYPRSRYPDLLPYLKQDNIDVQASTSPRSLCQECYNSKNWKVECKACKVPLCKEHDLRGLKTRVCGYRDLLVERDLVRSPPKIEIGGDAVPDTTDSEDTLEEEALDNVLYCLRDLFWTFEDSIRLLEDAAATGLPNSPDDDLQEDTDMWPSIFPIESGTEHGKSSISTVMTTFSFSPTFSPKRAQTKAESESLMQLATKCLDDDLVIEQSWFALGEKESDILARKAKMDEWVGCGAYFCQASYRPVGDNRSRCTAAMRVCSTCGIHQCKVCDIDHSLDSLKH
jgi:hypothetical protein